MGILFKEPLATEAVLAKLKPMRGLRKLALSSKVRLSLKKFYLVHIGT